jgi:hypothetical protein
MPKFVHVAKIMPGQRQAFQDYMTNGFTTAREALKSFGFTKVTSFVTPEVSDDDGGLLVTVYEAKDASVVENFYSMQAVIENERKAHGVMVVPHEHDSLPTNTPFLELDLA